MFTYIHTHTYTYTYQQEGKRANDGCRGSRGRDWGQLQPHRSRAARPPTHAPDYERDGNIYRNKCVCVCVFVCVCVCTISVCGSVY